MKNREAVAIIVGIPTHEYTEGGARPKSAEEFRDVAIKALEAADAFKPDAPMPAHITDFIEEEMKARGWTWRDLAERMGGDPDHEELAFNFLRIRDPGVFLGEEGAAAIGRAFGTGPELWINLDNGWRAAARARIQEHATELYTALRMIFFSYEDDCDCECDTETCCAKVRERCAKCESRRAIALIDDPYAAMSLDQQPSQASQALKQNGDAVMT
jgi:plasmid maintenance system antidote protein VapI